MDLDEPAEVHWPENLSSDIVRGAHKKSCETVAEAVCYVMETLSEPFRPSAYISVPGQHLDYRAILAIYESPEYKDFKD
jgi:hypothetical protein